MIARRTVRHYAAALQLGFICSAVTAVILTTSSALAAEGWVCSETKGGPYKTDLSTSYVFLPPVEYRIDGNTLKGELYGAIDKSVFDAKILSDDPDALIAFFSGKVLLDNGMVLNDFSLLLNKSNGDMMLVSAQPHSANPPLVGHSRCKSF